jgi:hypothetical protein
MPAGVVDKTINSAMRVNGAGDQVVNLFGVPHVAVDENDFANLGAIGSRNDWQFSGGAFSFVFVVATDNNSCSGL